jgi:thiol-disulfide isomerase/thioredoxin
MKRAVLAAFASLFAVLFAHAQNEQSPIVEKEISYKNWTYKDIRTGQDVNLRDYTKGKKLTIVIYWAPWCHNWQHDAPMVESLYEKYKDKGLGFIGVGEYGTVDQMKGILDQFKITFPAVYESVTQADREKTLHYGYRHSTGDARNWGSPYYVFLIPSSMEKKGDELTKKTFVINGEMIQTEGEAFIRKQLKLPPLEQPKPAGASDTVSKADSRDTSVKPVDLKKQ